MASTIILNNNTSIVYGYNKITGLYVDVKDKRFRGNRLDESNEGILVEYSFLFKFMVNHIGLPEICINNGEKIIKLTDDFINRLDNDKKIKQNSN